MFFWKFNINKLFFYKLKFNKSQFVLWRNQLFGWLWLFVIVYECEVDMQWMILEDLYGLWMTLKKGKCNVIIIRYVVYLFIFYRSKCNFIFCVSFCRWCVKMSTVCSCRRAGSDCEVSSRPRLTPRSWCPSTTGVPPEHYILTLLCYQWVNKKSKGNYAAITG